MIARRRPVRAGRRWPARRTSNHARTSQVDRATDDPIMRAATSYWAPFQTHPGGSARVIHRLSVPSQATVSLWGTRCSAETDGPDPQNVTTG